MIACTWPTVALRVAESQKYVREIGGPNRGPAVQQFQAATHNVPPAAWCMSFGIWVLDTTLGHDKMPLKRSGRVQDVVDDAIVRKCVYDDPQVGDLFVKWYASLGRYAHTGFVQLVNSAGSFGTIEGNGNAEGGREGYGVISRLRGDSDDPAMYKFIRWSELI